MKQVTELCRYCEKPVPMGASHACPALAARNALPTPVAVPTIDPRTPEERLARPLMSHVVAVLEEECPMCGGPLAVARRGLAGVLRRVGSCDHCWLDFNAEVEQNGGQGCWRLMVVEREPA